MQLEKNPDYVNANKNYNSIEQEINRKEQAVKKFRSAQEEIKNLSSAIDERNKKHNNWDKDHKNAYQELAAYWDMLETGRDSHGGKMYSWAIGSKKAKQKAFDAQKQAIIDSYWQVGQTYAA
jgi:seryl-tRNA synthetase